MIRNISLEKICILCVSSIFIVSFFSPVAQSDQMATISADWVVMLYLNGDNKMSASQQQILQQIKTIGSSEKVVFTVLIDGDKTDDTKLYYIMDTTLEQQDWPAESDMSDAQTIKQFAQKVRTDVPSAHDALIVSSNKGSAWQGVSWDDHGDGVMITMPELTQACNEITENGVRPFDVLAIETCLGGNFEVIYQLQSVCKYYVGYADCGLVGDWPYKKSLSELKNDSSMSAADFASAIVDNFIPQSIPAYKLKTAMGATNTAMIGTLGNDIDALAEYLMGHMDAYRDQIIDALGNTRVYGEFWGINYFLDIIHFLNILDINTPEYDTIRTDIQNDINNAVIAKSCLMDDNCCGFNIYFPQVKGDYNNALRYESGVLPSPYEETRFAMETAWDECLRSFLSLDDNTPPSIPSLDGPKRGKALETYEYTFFATDADGDDLRYCIDWGDGSPELWTIAYPSGEIVTMSHCWNETGSYMVKVKARDEGYVESSWTTLEISMPLMRSSPSLKSYMLLIGSIRDVEEDQRFGFRFLPVHVANIGHTIEDGYYMRLMDEASGGFPCCGYIKSEDFKGMITSSFVCGVWLIA